MYLEMVMAVAMAMAITMVKAMSTTMGMAEVMVTLLVIVIQYNINPIQTGLFWPSLDWGGGGRQTLPPSVS